MFCTVHSQKKKKDILCLKICAVVINLCQNGLFSMGYFLKINIAEHAVDCTYDLFPPWATSLLLTSEVWLKMPIQVVVPVWSTWPGLWSPSLFDGTIFEHTSSISRHRAFSALPTCLLGLCWRGLCSAVCQIKKSRLYSSATPWWMNLLTAAQ